MSSNEQRRTAPFPVLNANPSFPQIVRNLSIWDHAKSLGLGAVGGVGIGYLAAPPSPQAPKRASIVAFSMMFTMIGYINALNDSHARLSGIADNTGDVQRYMEETREEREGKGRWIVDAEKRIQSELSEYRKSL